jgi:release factor glutamine methyltransferase
MTVEAALQQARKLLEDAAVIEPRLTAEVLLACALGRDRAWLYGHPEHELSDLHWLHYGRYLHERLQGKPTQYITHRQEFYGREFLVNRDVLIPRPETEHVIEAVLALARGAKDVLDVGCGSGAIAITLQLEMGATVWASDISFAALLVAAENARRLKARIQLLACDVMSAIGPRSVDLVVSNPPYVPETEAAGLQREIRDYEPPIALYGGPAGLDFYRRLAGDAPRVLRPGGWLIVELDYRAAEPVKRMLGGSWRDVQVNTDLAGLPRVLAARYQDTR